MDGGAWWATVHGVAKSQTRLSDSTKEENDPAMEDQRWQAGMKSKDSGASVSQFKRCLFKTTVTVPVSSAVCVFT